MNEAMTKKESWSYNSPSFVIARSVSRIQVTVAKLGMFFAVNERVRSRAKQRGNLPSLMDWRELFNGCKTASLRIRSKEIASGMQQRLAELRLKALPTEPRNDGNGGAIAP
jgi:hypothetical protein